MQKALNTKALSNKTKKQTNVGSFIFIKLQQPINLASSSKQIGIFVALINNNPNNNPNDIKYISIFVFIPTDILFHPHRYFLS